MGVGTAHERLGARLRAVRARQIPPVPAMAEFYWFGTPRGGAAVDAAANCGGLRAEGALGEDGGGGGGRRAATLEAESMERMEGLNGSGSTSPASDSTGIFPLSLSSLDYSGKQNTGIFGMKKI